MKPAFWRRLYVWARNKYRKALYNEWRVEANNIRKEGITVRHHALNRYFERVEGYNLDKIAEQLTEGLADIVAERGDGKYVVNGIRVTVIGRHIVTVDTNQTALSFRESATNPIRGLEKLREPGEHL